MSEFRVQIKDFQSLENVDISLEDGINVIVGKTNIGKSAIIRAIDSAIFNTGKDDMVRAGNRYAGVKIDNGSNAMFWRRDSHGKNEKTLYQINDDKPIVKVGRSQLPEIINMFNITDVRLANGVKDKINFWYQGDAPFLTNKTAGQLFIFLSQSSCEHYIGVVKQLKKDCKSQKSDIDVINANINTLKTINTGKKAILDNNKGFDNLYIRTVTLDNEIECYNNIEQYAERYESSIARKYIKHNSLMKVQKIINEINFKHIQNLYNEYDEANQSVDRIKYIFKTLTDKKTTRIQKYQDLEVINNKLSPMNDGLSRLSNDITELLETNDLITNIKRTVIEIEKKRDKVNNLKSTQNDLNQTLSNYNLASLSTQIEDMEYVHNQVENLNYTLTRYEYKANILGDKKDKLNNILIENGKVIKMFEEFKRDIGACPYCNSSFGR